MFCFTAIIQKFGNKGEKTGWTYVNIPKDLLIKLKLKDKKAFRLRGLIDDVKFEKMSTYPMGDGEFIFAINADLRKKIKKKEGAQVILKFEIDKSAPLISKELMDCLKEDAVALKQFQLQIASHQNYYHMYIESAKTPATKAGRIVHTIEAMHKKMSYGEMIRGLKQK